MYLTLLFCVSWVIFFTVMLQIVGRRSISGAQVSNRKPTQTMSSNDQPIAELTSESLYRKDWTKRHQGDDWARRRLSGISLR